MNHNPEHLDEINLTFVIIALLMIFLANTARAEFRQISLLGITAHGVATNRAGIKDMRNKITSDGFFAINPQLNLTYINDDGSFKNATVLIDCFAQPAVFIGTGKQYQVEENLTLGYVLGVYFRTVPPRDLSPAIRVGNYQIIPTPALSLQYKTKEGVYLRFQSNYVINFTDIAWEF